MKKLLPLVYLILVVILLESCRRGGNRHVKEGVDNAVMMFLYLLAIASFGVTAVALAFAYNKRKKDKDGLLVASLIVVGIFVMITQSAYQSYSFHLDDHPFVMGEFIVGICLIVLTAIQLVLGYRRKKDGFIEIDDNVTPKIDKKDKEIPDDQEIY